jgi:SAM-dependent methyltransferase
MSAPSLTPSIIDYRGWINRKIFQGKNFEYCLSGLERYQVKFLAKYAHFYKKGYLHVRGFPLYSGDHLYAWSRQYEYPYMVMNIPHDKKLRILDVGSGFNFLPAYLKDMGHEVVCTDIEDLTVFYKDSGLQFIQDDITQTQLSFDEPFDIIYSVSVLEHIPQQEKAFENIFKLLKPGGKLILTMDCDLAGSTIDATPSFEKACALLGQLQRLFEKDQSFESYDLIRDENMVTTLDFTGRQSWRLPWRKKPETYRQGWLYYLNLLTKPRQLPEIMPVLGVLVGTWHKPTA